MGTDGVTYAPMQSGLRPSLKMEGGWTGAAGHVSIAQPELQEH